MDYDALKLSNLSIIPTGDFEGLYKDDYQAMRENMIYGDHPEFEEILKVIGSIL